MLYKERPFIETDLDLFNILGVNMIPNNQLTRLKPCEKKEQKSTFYSQNKIPEVRKIIFNNPATIVMWKDGTKTIVKTSANDKFDKYTGFAMAYMKKIFGSSMKALKVMETLDEEYIETEKHKNKQHNCA